MTGYNVCLFNINEIKWRVVLTVYEQADHTGEKLCETSKIAKDVN